MSSEKMLNVYIPEDLLQDLKVMAAKDGTSIKKIVNVELEKYRECHKDGNPAFTLDQFNDPDFIACPAMFRDGRAWDNYLGKQTPEELETFKNQLIMVDKKLGKYL